jgi:hypothetical protein
MDSQLKVALDFLSMLNILKVQKAKEQCWYIHKLHMDAGKWEI